MKDKIGSVVRALNAVKLEYLGILLDLTIKLGGKDAAFWYGRLVAVSKEVVESASTILNIITIFPNLSLQERITLGKYDWVNPDINDNRFPYNESTVGEWEYDLYHPNRQISSEDAKKEAEVDGWQVAEVEHLLAFGQAFPEEQRKYPIIALGSVCEVSGVRHVLGLWTDGSRRGLYLDWWRGDWRSSYRFLRVRKTKN